MTTLICDDQTKQLGRFSGHFANVWNAAMGAPRFTWTTIRSLQRGTLEPSFIRLAALSKKGSLLTFNLEDAVPLRLTLVTPFHASGARLVRQSKATVLTRKYAQSVHTKLGRSKSQRIDVFHPGRRLSRRIVARRSLHKNSVLRSVMNDRFFEVLTT